MKGNVQTASQWSVNPITAEGDQGVGQQNSGQDTLAPNVEDPLYLATTQVKSSHKQLKVHIYSDASDFITDSQVTGCFDVKCKVGKNAIGIKTIVVQLCGVASVPNDTASAAGRGTRTEVFHQQKLIIQAPDTPPTDAVIPQMPNENVEGYLSAKKGKTRFNYQFKLPADLPPSVTTKLGSITYSIVVVIEFRQSFGEPQVLRQTKDIVVHQLVPKPNTGTANSLVSECHEWGMFNGKGQVELSANLRNNWIQAGSNAQVCVNLSNNSNRSVGAITLELVQRLKSFTRLTADKYMPNKFMRKVIAKQQYSTKDYNFDNRRTVLSLLVPPTEFSIANSQSLEITYIVRVVASAVFSKDLVVELPLNIFFEQSQQSVTVVDASIAGSQSQQQSDQVDVNSNQALSALALKPFDKGDSAFQSSASLDPVVNVDEQELHQHLDLPLTQSSRRRSSLSKQQIDDINAQFADTPAVNDASNVQASTDYPQASQDLDPRISAHLATANNNNKAQSSDANQSNETVFDDGETLKAGKSNEQNPNGQNQTNNDDNDDLHKSLDDIMSRLKSDW
ncbi:hypothetical protein MP228_012679 [Amoeboaphelidium protococcarum]|nr:hypothetical protein MP228_012679 [Amoeboaphelidium protococcarum]